VDEEMVWEKNYRNGEVGKSFYKRSSKNWLVGLPDGYPLKNLFR
jgi:hypothetical protein